MSISFVNPSIGQDSSVEFRPDRYVGGRISRFAGQILSLAPCMTRSLNVSVSSLALGSVVVAGLNGGGVAYSQSCTKTNNSATRTVTHNCTQSSITAATGFGRESEWGSNAGNINVNLGSSTNVEVSTGVAHIFQFFL